MKELLPFLINPQHESLGTKNFPLTIQIKKLAVITCTMLLHAMYSSKIKAQHKSLLNKQYVTERFTCDEKRKGLLKAEFFILQNMNKISHADHFITYSTL